MITQQVINLFEISSWMPEEYLELENKSVTYALLCQGGKVYCGFAPNIFNRFEKHLKGQGSMWTRRYKPIRILEIKMVTDHSLIYEEERSMTLTMMYYHGIENVRGGEYKFFQMQENEVKSLRNAIVEKFNLCYNCLESFQSHYGKSCKRERNSRFDFCSKCEKMGHTVRRCPLPVLRKRKREVSILRPMKLRNRTYHRFRVSDRIEYS